MITKILIANRGEIAIRIIRTCRKLGIKTVAIYSKIDQDSLHVFMADEAICTDSQNGNDGYTNYKSIILAAKNTRCDAIHPGYGFISESCEFVHEVEKNGLIWIGPSYSVMKRLEDKLKVKRIASKIGIPIIKDYKFNSIKEKDLPVAIKSVSGAGGRCIGIVERLQDLNDLYSDIKSKSLNYFNSSKVYIEKFIDGFRHIEIQFIADKFGNIIICPERDCTIQRRRQKIIEESPSSFLPGKIIDKLKSDAMLLIKECKYDNIGTIEFIVDKNLNYYFLEINPRIQVEHAVTEMICDIDLVEYQVNIALGNKIKNQIKKSKCYAIECRINAEDPYNNFYPSSGNVKFCNFPLGADIRIETCLYNGMYVNSYYDPLLMKIICRGKTRIAAIERMKQALRELIIEEIDTNCNYLLEIIESNDFKIGNYDLTYID